MRPPAAASGRRRTGAALALVALGLVSPFLLRRHPVPPAVSPDPRPPPRLLSGVTVILDPGHGGADSGAVRHGVCEAALTYRTAVELADAIRRQGGRVVFTVRSRTLAPELAAAEPPLRRPTDAVLAANGQPLRERDTPRPLWLRAAVARRLWNSSPPLLGRGGIRGRGAIFFLSLHYDEYALHSVHGALICVDPRMTSLPPLARLLAARLCADGLARPDILHGLRGLAAARLGVLDPRYNPVPERALLELATISNAEDAERAADPAWRRGMAVRITEALIAARRMQGTISRHDRRHTMAHRGGGGAAARTQ